MSKLTEVAPLRIANGLDAYGENIALAHASGVLSYSELARAVEEEALRFTDGRRLVAIGIRNEPDAIIAYLAALRARQPVILVSPDSPEAMDRIVSAYQPDTLYLPGSGWRDRHPAPQHDLHPDLALLLSTSGSTGSPKLVRLSYENLDANAASIAEYLRITESDRAATTLPLHYCYGLSVLHSYLLSGAGLILTSASVAEPEFWEAFAQHGGTSFAGVPYTFELLEQTGFAEMTLPALRYVTQAGGRMDPALVSKYARLGAERGWELVVMYGQTEATARMAYLPAELAADRPDSIGIPIPGGTFKLQPCDGFSGPDLGELVYSGPNVMLGYAETPADLARGRDIEELHTGDIARRAHDGLFEIVGRRNRFAKIFGLRFDLAQIENTLRSEGHDVLATATDEYLVIAVAGGSAGLIQRRALALTKLPAWAVSVVSVAELPRLANGKPDYPSVLALGKTAQAQAQTASHPEADVREVFGRVLNVPQETLSASDSFVSLGGNSLSYVTMSVRLEKQLGTLPANWHELSIAELERAVRPRSRFFRTIETPVLLRAVAIIAVVGVHIPLWKVLGGAHILLAVAGYMFARFTLRASTAAEQRRAVLKAFAGVAVPSVAWITAVYLTTDWYGLSNIFLVGRMIGPHTRTSGVLWFVEVLALILLCAAALLSVPSVARMQRRHPFAFPITLTVVGLVFQHGPPWSPIAPKDAVYLPFSFWLFTLGWAGWAARTWHQRIVVSAIAAVFLPWYFEDANRGFVVLAGVLLLLWLRSIRLPSPLVFCAALVAHSSLYIYLTHWQVFPFVRDEFGKWPALLASLAVGIAYHRAGSMALRAARRHLRLLPRVRWFHTGATRRGAMDNHAMDSDAAGSPAPKDREEQQKVYDATKDTKDPKEPKEHVSEGGAVGGSSGTTDGQ